MSPAAGYIWFEHWPDGRNDHTLNAHLNALFGLYDYWRVTGSPLAEQYFLGGAKTVRDKLYRFRRKGDLSRYSLSWRRRLAALPRDTHRPAAHPGQDDRRQVVRPAGRPVRARRGGWRAENRGGGR